MESNADWKFIQIKPHCEVSQCDRLNELLEQRPVEQVKDLNAKINTGTNILPFSLTDYFVPNTFSYFYAKKDGVKIQQFILIKDKTLTPAPAGFGFNKNRTWERHRLVSTALIPDWLGLRFRVRYIRIPECTKHTVSCFFLGPVCANSGITESRIRVIDCTYMGFSEKWKKISGLTVQ